MVGVDRYLKNFSSEDLIVDFTVATNSQQIFVNTDGNFTEALTSFVKNFEDVDASQASGKINVIGTDSEGSVTIDMNTVGGSGDDSLTTGSGADTIKELGQEMTS